MYLIIEENENCSPDERVFATIGSQKVIKKVEIEKPGKGSQWYEVAGVHENGKFQEALAQQVEDSSDGIAWLIFGGSWGIRFRPDGNNEDWSLKNPNQWGEPFLVLDKSGNSLQFKGEETKK